MLGWVQKPVNCGGRENARAPLPLAEWIEFERNVCSRRCAGGRIFPFFDGRHSGFRQDGIPPENFGAFHGSVRRNRDLQLHRSTDLAHSQNRRIVGLDAGKQFSITIGILRLRWNGRRCKERQEENQNPQDTGFHTRSLQFAPRHRTGPKATPAVVHKSPGCSLPERREPTRLARGPTTAQRAQDTVRCLSGEIHARNDFHRPSLGNMRLRR